MLKNRTGWFAFTLVLGVLLSRSVSALPFGTFDPKSLAMGGAGVASGTSENAAYYNPALMAMYKTRKERGNNSRYMFPVATLQVSDSILTIKDLDGENLEQNLESSISDFNTTPTAQNASAVLNAATDLQGNLGDLLDAPVYGDVIIGTVLSIAHKYGGGAIIITRRLVGDGAVANYSSDVQLLQESIDAMEFIEAGGDPAVAATQFPNVIDANGQIAFTTADLTSAAAGSGLDITEIGMAMSKQFNVYGKDIAFGLTPKVMKVSTYDLQADASTGSLDKVRQDGQDYDVNMDFGLAHQIDARWRAGIVIKNIHSLSYKTALGNTLKIRPQIRAGASYNWGWRGLYAFDIDVLPNDAVGTGSDSQVMSLGVEWPIKSYFKVRGGITRNMQGVGAANDPLYTLGIHWGPSFFLDAGIAYSSYELAGAIQLGHSF
jgi:hypothetical protein